MSTASEARTTLRAALRADAQAICDIHIATVKALCAPFYESVVIEGWLRGRIPEGYLRGIEQGMIFVAGDNGEVIGWGEAHPGEVDAIFVDPRYARRGIGSLLLNRALQTATRGGGTIKVQSTLNAIPFYQRFGFNLIGHSTQRRNDVDVPVATMEKHAG